MKIFNKIGDLTFKIIQIVFIVLFLCILGFIVKWRIDSLYISSLSENSVDLSLEDAVIKTKKDVQNISNKEASTSTSQPILEENTNVDLISIILPEGSNIDTVADVLIENNLMTDKVAFKSLVSSMGLTNKFCAGSFQIDKNSKIKDTILLLTNTKIKTYEVEISEGAAADAVGQKLQNLGIIESSKTFEQNCKEFNVFYKFKPGKYEIETPTTVKNIIIQLTGINI